MRSGARHFILFLAFIGLLLTLQACSGGDDQAEAAVLPTPEPAYEAVPAQYASAEALLEYCQRLLRSEPPQLDAFLNEIYYENADQQLFQQYVEQYLRPRVLFYQTLLTYFGEDARLREEMRGERITIPSDARVNHSQPGRADSLLVWIMNDRPTECPMQLVQIGNRWWVSGYSIEPVMDSLIRTDFRNSKANFRGWVTNESVGIKEEYENLKYRVNRREFSNFYEVLELEYAMLADHGANFYLR